MSKKHRKFSGFPGQAGSVNIAQPPPITVALDFNNMIRRWNPADCSELISRIEDKRGSKVICLVYNDAPPAPCYLAPALLTPLSKVLSAIGKATKIDLFLRSIGGVAEVPWRVVTLMREFCHELGVIVPQFALSGATHIAIAADELVLTPWSVLGSVDPIRQHPLLPKDAEGKPIATSVQDLKHCIQFIREQLGEVYSSQNLAVIIAELFHHIDPLAIGALEQSYSLSRLITEKVLKSRNKPPSQEVINSIQDKLGGGYFSHSFLISRREVETDLELPVFKPDQDLLELINGLNDLYNREFSRTIEAVAGNQQPIFKAGGYLQCRELGFLIGQVLKDGQLLTDPWLQLPGLEAENAS